jgi:3-oxoadipate enol-lactonase
MWSDHLGPLAEAGYRVLAFDLPGFGDAPIGDEPEADWTEVLRTLHGLSIDRAALIGNSMGAAVALRVAALAPQLVAALVLVSTLPPGLEPSEELAAAWDAEMTALDRGDIEAAVEAVVQAWTLPTATPELRHRVATMQRRAIEQQAHLDPDSTTEPPDPLEQQPDAIARIGAPSLVVAGEHDMIDFRRGAEELARNLPRARHASLNGAGHLAPLETPEPFRELVIGFLAEVYPA